MLCLEVCLDDTLPGNSATSVAVSALHALAMSRIGERGRLWRGRLELHRDISGQIVGC
jgi:hypothetical protein